MVIVFSNIDCLGLPSTRHVISSGVKVAKGGRSSSRVSPWNISVNFSRTEGGI